VKIRRRWWREKWLWCGQGCEGPRTSTNMVVLLSNNSSTPGVFRRTNFAKGSLGQRQHRERNPPMPWYYTCCLPLRAVFCIPYTHTWTFGVRGGPP
jgi:hypothetical protein